MVSYISTNFDKLHFVKEMIEEFRKQIGEKVNSFEGVVNIFDNTNFSFGEAKANNPSNVLPSADEVLSMLTALVRCEVESCIHRWLHKSDSKISIRQDSFSHIIQKLLIDKLDLHQR